MILSTGDYAIRGVDTAGITQYATVTGADKTFTVLAVGVGAKVETKINADTPAEGIALIDADAVTEHEVLRFDLKVTKDAAQVRTVEITLAGDTAIANITDVRLYNGTTVIGSEEASTTVTFEDLEVDIAKDTTKTLSVKVEYAATTTESSIIVASTGVEAVSANEENVTYSGSATGNIISFYAVAPVVTFVSQAITETVDSITTTLTAWFDGTITFKLTAQGEDIVIPTDGIEISGWDVANATSNSAYVTTTATLITIDCKVLGAGLATTSRTIADGTSRTIVAKARITDVATGNRYYEFRIISVGWEPSQSLSADLIADLKTSALIFVKP
jgi:hypothetical protein